MNQPELVEKMALEMGTTKKFAKEALDAVLNGIEGALSEGDSVKLVGFGQFEVKDVAERVGHNIQTGGKMTIPATKKVSFKASKVLKDVVKGLR